MKTTISKITRKDVSGTYLQGYLYASYKELVKVFGEPNYGRSPDGKIQVEWCLKINDTIVTIYDYKENVPPEEVTEWHIGGNSRDDAATETISFFQKERKKLYKVVNQLDKESIILSIVETNRYRRKYNYSADEVQPWVETLPNKGDYIELENAQCTGFFSDLLSRWGTRKVGYTYCLFISKWKDKETGERLCHLSLGDQQTIGRRFYGISPKVSKNRKS